MAVSSLREITVGVADLHSRKGQFENGCGLSSLAAGPLTAATAWRLFDLPNAPQTIVLGRADVVDSPRVRLVEVRHGAAARPNGVASPGPLGIGFATRGIRRVHARLERSCRFLSGPLPLSNSLQQGAGEGKPEYQALGQSTDGDFLILKEPADVDSRFGAIGVDCSEPLQASIVVTNLEASTHFMVDVLEHEATPPETHSGPPFSNLFGMSASVQFRLSTAVRPGFAAGHAMFIEFEKNRAPMVPTPWLGRGICRLRYDTTDLHGTLSRVPGGGGSLVRGPAGVDDPVLGRGLVAMVRAPFGVVIELWQTA